MALLDWLRRLGAAGAAANARAACERRRRAEAEVDAVASRLAAAAHRTAA